MAAFGPWDYTVLAIVLIAFSSIGVYYRFTGGKQRTTKEFLLADRSMSILPVALGFMATALSPVSMLGASMEIYLYGTQVVLLYMAAVLVAPISAFLILPVFYRLKLTSIYEYLELRFGYPTRLLASLAFSVQTILYLGIVLFAPALALEAVTGLNQILSIIVVGVVCTFYATLGGMKAVLVTDMLQSLLMFAAVYSVIICAGIKAGSLDVIWKTASQGERLEFWNLSVDPTTRHSVWTQLIGGSATYVSMFVNQTQIQRLLSVRNLKSSQAALWWGVPVLMAMNFSISFSGLCIYYYYRDCDPLLQGRITSGDQVMPLFVVDTLSQIPAISGLFVSGIFSACLSTISSGISSLAAVTLEDYLKPLILWWYKRQLNENKTIWYSKLLSFSYGIICIAIAFLAKSMSGLQQTTLSISGIIGGPILGLFTIGMYVPSANQKGAITGLLTGLALSFWMGFGKPKPANPILPMSIDGCPIETAKSHVYDVFDLPRVADTEEPHYFYLYRISYMWYAVLGFLCTFIVGVAFSWIYSLLRWDSTAHIYTDATCTQIKYDLFVLPLAKRLRRKQMPGSKIDDGSATPSMDESEKQSVTKSTSNRAKDMEYAAVYKTLE